MLIDGIRLLNNLKMANSDGIDPDHCQNVRISNCHIECGDDAIVLKNSGIIRNTVPVKISWSPIVPWYPPVLPSNSARRGESDFRNILVENCCISRSNRGISIQIRDNGNVENVIFSNIIMETRRFSYEWWGRAEAVCLTALDRKPGVKAGKIRNIRFQNITCEGENGIFLLGSEDNYIEDVTFEGIRLTLDKKSKWEINGYDKRPCQGERERSTQRFPESMRDYVKNVSFHDIQITKKEGILPFYRGGRDTGKCRKCTDRCRRAGRWGARMEKSNRRIALIGFAILMVGLGISDSLRGIFSGIFQTHFALTAKGLSTIIAVSYAGNLCFPAGRRQNHG